MPAPQDAIVDNPYKAYGRDDIIDQPGVFPRQPGAVLPVNPAAPAAPPPGAGGAAPSGSPTELIHAYLTARGLQPTGENVRAALLANARDPGTIAGLINQAPPEAGAGGGAGGAGGGAPAAQVAPTGKQGPGRDAIVDMPHPEFPAAPRDAIIDQPGVLRGAPAFNPTAADIASAITLAGSPGLAYVLTRGGKPGEGAAAPAESTKPAEVKAKPAEVVAASEEGAAAKAAPTEPPKAGAPRRADLLNTSALTPQPATIGRPGPLRKPPVAGLNPELAELLLRARGAR